MGTSSLNAIIITQGSPTQPAGRMKDPVGRRASPQPAHQQSTALRVGQADPQTIEGVGNSHRGFSFLFRKTRTLGSFSLPPLMVGRGSQPHPSWLSGPLGPHQDWNPGGLWSAAQSCGPAMVSVSAEGATFLLLFPDTYSLVLSISLAWGQGPLCQFSGP